MLKTGLWFLFSLFSQKYFLKINKKNSQKINYGGIATFQATIVIKSGTSNIIHYQLLSKRKFQKYGKTRDWREDGDSNAYSEKVISSKENKEQFFVKQ